MFEIFGNFESKGTSKKYVGLTLATVKSITVDDKLTNDNSKRFDINMEYTPNDTPLKTKISFWSKPEYETSKNGKVRFIDGTGKFLDSWLSPDLENFETKQKLAGSKLVNPRPSYANERILADFVKILIGYKQDIGKDLLDMGSGGFSIPKMFKGEDEFLNMLNEKLSQSDKHITIMMGINDGGYQEPYKYKFSYSSIFNKEENLHKTIEDYAKLSDRYYKQIESSLKYKAKQLDKDVTKLTQEEVFDVMQYKKESGIYYAGKLTEFSDDLDKNLLIDFKSIRDNVVKDLIPVDDTKSDDYSPF